MESRCTGTQGSLINPKHEALEGFVMVLFSVDGTKKAYVSPCQHCSAMVIVSVDDAGADVSELQLTGEKFRAFDADLKTVEATVADLSKRQESLDSSMTTLQEELTTLQEELGAKAAAPAVITAAAAGTSGA